MASYYENIQTEEKFSFFCKYNELPRVVACPKINLPSLKDSCFDPNYKEEFQKRFGIEAPYF